VVLTAAAALLNQTRPRGTSTFCCRNYFSNAFVVFSEFVLIFYQLKLNLWCYYSGSALSASHLKYYCDILVQHYLQVISNTTVLLWFNTICKSSQVL
ncbi:hypothetical protein PS6_011713, partial [Mucor atramentarius]